MQAIVVTFDRLATRLLGCYGNEWIETPNFDRLAAGCTVFDNHFTDSVGPRRGQSWLTGRHALKSQMQPVARPLGSALESAGVVSSIMTVDQAHDLGWSSAGFASVQRILGSEGLDAHPTEVTFANLVRAGIELIRRPSTSAQNRLLWLHASEPSVPPEGFATLYADDFEERGVILNEIPREDWSRQIAVAAGSMSLIDHWLGELITQIRENTRQEPTLLLIAGGTGRSWADEFLATACAAQTGSPAALLRDMETRCPLLLTVLGSHRDSEYQGIRCQRFVQPMDVAATLRDWFQLPETSPSGSRSLLQEALSEDPGRTEVSCSDDHQSFGIRNADWNCLMRVSSSPHDARLELAANNITATEQVQLFSKPEDVWDVTDLATQYPETCDELIAKLMAFRASGLTAPVPA